MNYTQDKYIKVSISSGSIPSEDLPTVCRSLVGTLCGSFLTSSGPCRRPGRLAAVIGVVLLVVLVAYASSLPR